MKKYLPIVLIAIGLNSCASFYHPGDSQSYTHRISTSSKKIKPGKVILPKSGINSNDESLGLRGNGRFFDKRMGRIPGEGPDIWFRK